MAERRVLVKLFSIFCAGVVFYTSVYSQELGKPLKALQLEDERLVERARSVEKKQDLKSTTLQLEDERLVERARSVEKKQDLKSATLQLEDEGLVERTKELKSTHLYQIRSELKTKGSHMEKDRTDRQSQEQYFRVNAAEFNKRRPNLSKRGKVRKPRAEPEASPSSEPEVNPESETQPEGNPNSTSEPEQSLQAEPEPEWKTAVKQWKTAWPLHVYGIASIFVVLGIISLLELVRIHVRSRRKTALKVSLLIMIAIFCTTRSVVLFTDPYGSKGTINPTVLRILFAMGHPCIISSMSLLLLVLIDTTKMNVAPPTFQRVQCIIAVVFCHVVLVLITDITIVYYFEMKVLILVCQIYYLILGFILTIGYAKVGIKIAINSSASVTRDTKMEKLKVLIALASVTGLTMVGVTIYGAVGVFGIYSDVKVVDPWPWWVFQTVLRVLEIFMVIVLLVMNVKVSGAGLSIRELFRKYRRKLIPNKVEAEGTTPVIPISQTNSWLTPSLDTYGEK